jgi:hypothetical protein
MGNRTVGNRGANTSRPQGQDRTPLHVRVRIEQRDARLLRLGFKSYSAYLASGHWDATKARYRGSSLPQACVLCDDSQVQLHHTTYERVGEEDLADLAPLCATCHQLVHALERRGDMGLDFAGLVSAQRSVRYAEEGQGEIKGPTWADLHRGEFSRHRVAEVNRAMRDLLRRYEKRGMDTAPVVASLRAALKEGHRILSRSNAGPLPFSDEQAHAVSRADAEVIEREREVATQQLRGKPGKLATAALERAERRAQRARGSA